VAVIPVSDDEAGAIPKAFVAPRHDADPDEIMAFAAERVSPYKRIRRLEVIDQIPKSVSGKIPRWVLVERERERGPPVAGSRPVGGARPEKPVSFRAHSASAPASHKRRKNEFAGLRLSGKYPLHVVSGG
jgi:hypothetical protein